MPAKRPFNLKPEAALQYWRSKGLRITDQQFRKLSAAARDQAVYATGLHELHSVAAIRTSIENALDRGLTLQQVKGALRNSLSKEVTHRRQNKLMPKSAVERLERDMNVILNNRRLRTVFRTNMLSAYHAGHWHALQEATAAGQERLIMYDSIDDARTRPHHAALNGLVRPANDPIWKSIWPPNGYNCRCRVIALPPAMAKAQGIKATSPASMKKMLGSRFPDNGFDNVPGKNVFAQLLPQALRKLKSPKARMGRWKQYGPGLQATIDQDWREFIEAMAVESHDVAGRNVTKRYVGVVMDANPVSETDVAGLVLSVGDSGVKDTYRRLIRTDKLNLLEAQDLLSKLPQAIKQAKAYRSIDTLIFSTGIANLYFNFKILGTEAKLTNIVKVKVEAPYWKKIGGTTDGNSS